MRGWPSTIQNFAHPDMQIHLMKNLAMAGFISIAPRAMELATGKPDFNFKKTVRRLYVEQRELAQPVTLTFPTFAAAAEASGISRIWAGVHWPADDERGQELGGKVGENAWRRAQQCERSQEDPLSAIEAIISATDSDGVVTIPWTSDGVQSFRVSIEARADDSGARLLVSAIKATRVWPTVAGSPRYYEPSSAGHPDQ
jgi:hypothetical protein